MNNKIIRSSKVYLKCIAVLLIVFSAPLLSAKDYTFSWAENRGVEGYKIYYKEGGVAAAPFDGEIANEGASPIDIGNNSLFTISGLDENKTYHFTITAYTGSVESDFTAVITVSPELAVIPSDGDSVNSDGGTGLPDSDSVNSDGGSTPPDADSVNSDSGSTPPEYGTAPSDVDTNLLENEKIRRFKLAFPIILDFLLKSNSKL